MTRIVYVFIPVRVTDDLQMHVDVGGARAVVSASAVNDMNENKELPLWTWFVPNPWRPDAGSRGGCVSS